MTQEIITWIAAAIVCLLGPTFICYLTYRRYLSGLSIWYSAIALPLLFFACFVAFAFAILATNLIPFQR